MSLADRADPGAAASRRTGQHESFLVYARFRFLKIAAALVAASVLLYVFDVPYGSRYGGTWAGWTLGIVGALLIVWLTWFGYRKRSYLKPATELVAWLSAHVYFGLALLVIATLHTGFYFGWDIHTLAYVLMCAVIGSGAFGIFCYVRYPQRITANRGGATLRQMLGRIATLDDDLRRAARGAEDEIATAVARAVETTEIGGSLRRQLSRRYPGCATAAALLRISRTEFGGSAERDAAMRQIRMLLEQKALLLERARRDIRLKAIMEVWLYVHVPMSFALLAALAAHIIAVLWLW